MVVLNAAVCISTVTTGWHYATDVVGGILIAALAVLLTRSLGSWVHSEEQQIPSPIGSV